MNTGVLIALILVAILIPTGLAVFLYFYVKKRDSMETVRKQLSKSNDATISSNPVQYLDDLKEGKFVGKDVSEEEVKSALKRKEK